MAAFSDESADHKWIQVKTHMANLEPLPREFRFNLRSIFVLTAAIAALFAAARVLGIVLLSTVVLFIFLLVDACLGMCVFSRIRRRLHQVWDVLTPL